MDLTIFIIGFLVTMTVVYGIFSQVPSEMSPPEGVTVKNVDQDFREE